MFFREGMECLDSHSPKPAFAFVHCARKREGEVAYQTTSHLWKLFFQFAALFSRQ